MEQSQIDNILERKVENNLEKSQSRLDRTFESIKKDFRWLLKRPVKTFLSETILNHDKIEEEAHRRFDPNSPKIKFDSNTEANKLTQDIAIDVADVFKDADERINSIANQLIKHATKDIALQINQAIEETLNKAQEKLQDDGIQVNFKLPDIDLAFDEIDASALFNIAHQEKTESRTRWRKHKLWGWLSRLNDDWGWESYSVSETVYEVDIEKIRDQVLAQLKDQAGEISNQTGDYMNKKFQPEIDQHLTQLVNYLERYRGVLEEVIQTNELDAKSKAELLGQMKELQKHQTTLNNDVLAVSSTI